MHWLKFGRIFAFENSPFAGWAPIMSTILFIGGAIMQMRGVLGEYV